MMAKALSDNERTLIDAYWRAANYLSVGQIYLYDNPLLKQTLTKEHIKPRLLGHWGTTPGLNFIYVHLNRVIKKHDLDMIYITGPGHGGPGLVAALTDCGLVPTRLRRISCQGFHNIQ
jgi:xylulose-5-phosphate/fructose-6-phosphate phosphoketolase